MSELTLIGNGGSTGWIWDYRCDCGLDYRVRSVAGGAQFWPSNGPSRFSQHSRHAGEDCLKCGQILSLDNCVIRDKRQLAP